MTAKPMPLPQAIDESVVAQCRRLNNPGCSTACDACKNEGLAFLRALAARGWPLWPQEPTQAMIVKAYATPCRLLRAGANAVYAAFGSALPSLDKLLNPEGSEVADEFVNVVITARQTVQYSQYRLIKKSEFEKYKRMVNEEAHDFEFSQAFGDYIDRADVCDAGDFEDLEISKAQP